MKAMRTGLAVVFSLMLLLSRGAATAAPTESVDLLYSFYAGVDALGLDTAKLGQVFDIARSGLGLNYLKVNFRWDQIEPAADTFDWTVTEQVAVYAESHNLSIVPFFNQEGTPLWARKTPTVDTSDCTQGVTYITADPGYFAEYVYQFLTRYKERMAIRYIELENEPNALCLWPDTAQYLAEVDNAVYDRVKGLDPAIRVCSASFHQPLGLPKDSAGFPTDLPGDHAYSTAFLYEYLTYLNKGFDCFSLHDYGRLGFTETDPVYEYSSQYDLESNYRTALDLYGFQNTAIVFTECPYDINMFGDDENFAAAQLTQGYILAHAKGVGEGRLCQAIAAGPLKANVDYGIADVAGATPVYYAGYYAFQTLRAMMLAYPEHVRHLAGLVNDNGYWLEEFAAPDGPRLLVAFVPIRFDTDKGLPPAAPPAAQTAVINIGAGKTAALTAMAGDQSSLAADASGNISLTVSAEPQYIEVAGDQSCPNPPVRIADPNPVHYSDLQTAYDNAPEGATIQSQAAALTVSPYFDRNIRVTLDGGYDCDYTVVLGSTEATGPLRIDNGTVVIKNFVVK